MVKTTIYSQSCWNPDQLQPFSQSRWYGFYVVNHIPKRRCLSFPGRLFVNMASFPAKGIRLKRESYEVLLGEHLRSLLKLYMDVSENSGTPKSSILIGFSIINHPFWATTIFGNAYIKPWILCLKGITCHPKIPQLNSNRAEGVSITSHLELHCNWTPYTREGQGSNVLFCGSMNNLQKIGKAEEAFWDKGFGWNTRCKILNLHSKWRAYRDELKEVQHIRCVILSAASFWECVCSKLVNFKMLTWPKAQLISLHSRFHGIPRHPFLKTFGQWTTPTDRLWHRVPGTCTDAQLNVPFCVFFEKSLKLMQSQRLIDETLVVEPTPLKNII